MTSTAVVSFSEQGGVLRPREWGDAEWISVRQAERAAAEMKDQAQRGRERGAEEEKGRRMVLDMRAYVCVSVRHGITM